MLNSVSEGKLIDVLSVVSPLPFPLSAPVGNENFHPRHLKTISGPESLVLAISGNQAYIDFEKINSFNFSQ